MEGRNADGELILERENQEEEDDDEGERGERRALGEGEEGKTGRIAAAAAGEKRAMGDICIIELKKKKKIKKMMDSKDRYLELKKRDTIFSKD